MNMPTRIVIALVVALVAGGGYMTFDKMRGAEWVVSPQQIAEAQAKGQTGYESRPGTVTVRPIRSETADVLPMKWALIGLIAGLFAFRATGKKKRPRSETSPLETPALCAGVLSRRAFKRPRSFPERGPNCRGRSWRAPRCHNRPCAGPRPAIADRPHPSWRREWWCRRNPNRARRDRCRCD